MFSTLERLPGKGDKPGGDRVLAHFRIYIALAVLGVIGCIGSPVVEAADATYSFDLPEQPLADALRAIGHEAAVNIIFAPEVVDGVRSPAIHGNLTVDQAVRQALAGKNLQIRQATPSSMVIERPSQDNSPPIAQEETQNQQELAEVVVTAQKRAERLQDVPVSVSAVSGTTLEATRATSLADYAAFVPGLQVTSYTGQPSQVNLTLRGISTGSSAANQTVAIYVDEVPVGSSSIYAFGGSSGIDLLPYDVERIEVLEGPQGTLYGASSLGGLLKYVTREPNLQETQFRVGGDVSDLYNATRAGYGVRASANVPLIPGELAFSASVSQAYTPGYIDNVATNERSFNSGRQDAGRLAVLWSPTSQLSIELSAMLNRSPFNGAGYVSVDQTTGQPTAGRYANTDPEPDSNNVTTQLYTARLRYDMGWGSVTSVSGYSRMSTFSQADASSIYFPIFGDYADFASRADIKKFTQEIRLASSGQRTLQWLVGAFFTNEDAHQSSVGSALTPGINQPDRAFDPLLSIVEPSRFREVAGFANATWKVLDQWDISAGIRDSHNVQSVHESAFGSVFGATSSEQLVTDFPQVSQSKVTYSVSSSYHFSPDQMLYARVATGYRPGGANQLAPGVPPTFGADTTTNYEIGFKSEWLDRKLLLDLTQYYIDWQDTQITAATPLNLFYISNAGAAISRGTELTTAVRPVRGLSIGVNAAYTNARLTKDAPGLGGMRGDQLPGTPKFSGSLIASYEHLLVRDFTGQFNAVWRLVGGRNTLFPGSADVGTPNFRLSSYNTLDLSAGVNRGGWSTRLFVRNATNKYAYTTSISGEPALNAILMPRTLGLSLDVTF